MTARFRLPNAMPLLAAIVEANDATFGPVEDHVGKRWVAVQRNPCNVAVVGAREVLG